MKLIQEVEEMKVSQLKCIVKMNMLEQELVQSLILICLSFA